MDPLVGNPLNAQDYNGYSYCANNPLAFTDPSGYQKYATPEVYCIPGSEFYLNRIFGGGGGGGIGGGGDGGASGYSGMGSLDYGLPGQGQNGPGANGLYYDWVSGTMRSTATLQPANYEVIDHYFQAKYTHSDGTTTYGEKYFSYTSLKVAYDISPANAKAGGDGGVNPNFLDYAMLYFRFRYDGPDAISISGDVDVYAVGGSSVTPGGALIMISGKTPGKIVGFSDIGAGGGIPSVSAMGVLTEYFYIGGDVSNLMLNDFGGNRTQMNFSFGEGLSGAIGITAMNGPNGEGIIFGVSVGIGAGASSLPFGFNINGGTTVLWKK